MPAIPEQRQRAVLTRLASVLASWLLLLTASAVLMASGGIRINLSGSAPIGLYRLTPGELARGSLVAVCPELANPAVRVARERGYLADRPLRRRTLSHTGSPAPSVARFRRKSWRTGTGCRNGSTGTNRNCRTQADRDRAGDLAVPRCSFHLDLNVPGFAVRCTNPARQLMNGE